MSNRQVNHPEMELLEAFGMGLLSDEDSVEIESHLTICDECCQKVDIVPDDDLVWLLRDANIETTDGTLSHSAETDELYPTSKAVHADFSLPQQLEDHPRYLVLEPLGAGGMGCVYKARHRLMERIVALKIVNPQLVCKPGAVERFTREVRAAAQLVHPNIVTAYDAETVGEMHMLVMEYVAGETLAQILATQLELPIAKCCEYLRQTAIGLQHALDRGMVHRDIKPQNLMIARNGELKILDFGLARFISEQADLDGSTAVGTLMGSPDYMAPEQGEDAHAADTRADIYGMGCTLYHLVARRIPFPATSLLSKLEAHRDKPPLSLNEVRPAVPVELSRVVAKMMAKDPAERYQTPADVAEALLPFTRSSEFVPLMAPATASKANRKSLLPRAIAIGLVLAAIGCFAALIVFTLATPEGTLIVTTDDPDVQISVKSGGKEVKLFFPRDKQEIPLKVGPYTLELVGGKEGLTLSTNKFEIKSSKDHRAVSVEFLPTLAAAEIVQQERAVDPDAEGAIDRRAAKYVLSIGSRVRVNEQDRDILNDNDLPLESFRLTAIYLNSNPQISDASLTHFKDCKHLRDIGLGVTNVSDVGLANFKDCRHLKMLALNETQVSDAGLEIFKDCKDLTFLFLDKTGISDVGLASFKGRNLTVLCLSRTAVTDVGLGYFKDCKNLYWLWLNDTNVSDSGLAHFAGCNNMRYLTLNKTQISDAGLMHFSNCKNLIDLFLSGTSVTDEGLARFKDLVNLKQLNLSNTQVSDVGIAGFKDCKNLDELDLRSTNVSAAGVAEFKKALPQCKIEWDGSVRIVD